MKRDAITGSTAERCQDHQPDNLRRRCGKSGQWYTAVKRDGTKRVPVFRCRVHKPTMPLERWIVVAYYIEPQAVPA